MNICLCSGVSDYDRSNFQYCRFTSGASKVASAHSTRAPCRASITERYIRNSRLWVGQIYSAQPDGHRIV